MSPSLRDLTAEYVKSRLQSVKIPPSASGRFNVNIKTRIPNRLRKPRSKGLLESAPKDEEPSLANENDYCLVETNETAQGSVRAGARYPLTHDSPEVQQDKRDGLHENSFEELTLVAFLKEHDRTKLPAVASATPCYIPNGTASGDVSHPNDHSFSSVSDTMSSGSCTPRDVFNFSHSSPSAGPNRSSCAPGVADVERAPPGLVDASPDDVAPVPNINTVSSPIPPCCAEFSDSPVGSDILTALDAFDFHGTDLPQCDLDYAIPIRSLQTIYEEDPTMLDTHGSLSNAKAAKGEVPAVASASVEADATDSPKPLEEPLAQPALTFVSTVPWFSRKLFYLASLASQRQSCARTLPPSSPIQDYRPFERSTSTPCPAPDHVIVFSSDEVD